MKLTKALSDPCGREMEGRTDLSPLVGATSSGHGHGDAAATVVRLAGAISYCMSGRVYPVIHCSERQYSAGQIASELARNVRPFPFIRSANSPERVSYHSSWFVVTGIPVSMTVCPAVRECGLGSGWARQQEEGDGTVKEKTDDQPNK